MSFESLGLSPALLKALTDQGYTEATPVQQQAIPAALEGGDLIVSARTGSGKTAAFLLPAMERMVREPNKKSRGPRMLVLTPTRELARQVTTASQKYSRHIAGMRTVAILGGIPYGQQQRMLARPFDILVATPGRLLDLLDQSRIDMSGVELLVLDEADRMLDMGFIDDVEAIVGRIPATRQTLLFSATVEGDLAGLAGRILKSPQHIRVDNIREQHGNISQHLYFSDDIDHKKALLTAILGKQEVDQAIVFTATKVDAEALANDLSEWGLSCAALHGDMRQSARNRTLERLHSKKLKVLVATDVAARGIDVVGISHVVNFDLPRVVEDYVHRIGRTGRGGRSGTAVSLVSHRDRAMLTRISHYTGQHLEADTIPGLEPKQRTESRAPGGAGRWKKDGRSGNAPRPARRFSEDGNRQDRNQSFNREEGGYRRSEGGRFQQEGNRFSHNEGRSHSRGDTRGDHSGRSFSRGESSGQGRNGNHFERQERPERQEGRSHGRDSNHAPREGSHYGRHDGRGYHRNGAHADREERGENRGRGRFSSYSR